jgi:hypothetical protein
VKGPALPAPSSTISLHRAALSPLGPARPRGCARGPRDPRGACALAHNNLGSYGVMLLAVAIVLLGIVVLAVTWRRGRAGAYRAPVRDEPKS